MAGIWNSENKILPGAYINIKTNENLSITNNERGRVLILQELSTGEDNKIYKLDRDEDTFEKGASTEDKMLANLALMNASKVSVLKLKTGHVLSDIKESLSLIKALSFDVLVYPYDEEKNDLKEEIKSFVTDMRDNEGTKITAVVPNFKANHEAIINVVQKLILLDDTSLDVCKVSAFVGGLCAGTSMIKSNTGLLIDTAKDVEPRLTKTQLEEAVTAGKFVFKVDNSENVSIVYDINSLTVFSQEKSKMFSKNRVVRTIDSIANDIAKIFEANYIGKLNNNADGRNILKSSLIDYFKLLQSLNAIEAFDSKDVNIKPGNNIDSVIIDLKVKPVDSVEKIYLSVNLG